MSAETPSTPDPAPSAASGNGSGAAGDSTAGNASDPAQAAAGDSASGNGSAGDSASGNDSAGAGDSTTGDTSDSAQAPAPAAEIAFFWAAVPPGDARLLTGLRAEVGPDGVTLAWSVDEDRADRISGFSCVFRSPSHLRLGVSGVAPCVASEPIGPQARSVVLTGLPEFGDYDFEVFARTGGDRPPVPWTESALRMMITVDEMAAGPPGPGRVVTGVPLVATCGPEPGDPAGEAWRLDQIVSAAHVTHYPGRGWAPGGDPAAAPDWPEPPSLADLFDQADLNAEPIRQALDGDTPLDGDTAQQAADLLADERADAPLARASAGTKALLRPAPGPDTGGHELRLHSSYPFGGVYEFGAAHAVAGWGDPAAGAASAGLWRRTDCPPTAQPDALHNVALALSAGAGDGRTLEHSGYGWWAVAPVGLFPERIVATKGGLSYGEPAPALPEAGTVWQGRVSGHVFWEQQRWALDGRLTLEFSSRVVRGEFTGRIDNVTLVPLDLDTLEPDGPAVRWRSLTLADAGDTGDGAWSGPVEVGPAVDGLAGMPPADRFEGDWRVASYGPGAGEVAGRLRLWTPLADGEDAADGWPAQALVVAGFGGVAR